MRASSEVHHWRAYDARKDGQRAWVPSVLDNAWIQVDFLTVVRVKKILTQGRPDRDHWVKRYYVSYVGDGSDFQNVTDSDGKLKVIYGMLPGISKKCDAQKSSMNNLQ